MSGLASNLPEMLVSSLIFFAGYALNQIAFETINYYEEDKDKAIRYKYFYILCLIIILLIIIFNTGRITRVLTPYIN